jgi:hypothetical protein
MYLFQLSLFLSDTLYFVIINCKRKEKTKDNSALNCGNLSNSAPARVYMYTYACINFERIVLLDFIHRLVSQEQTKLRN